MRSKSSSHSIDTLFTLLLLLAFLLFSVLLAEVGSAVYRKASDSLQENYTSRTALSYLTEKLRQYDEQDAIFITDVSGYPALALQEEQNDDLYLTYLYYYDGALRELFTKASTDAAPEMGTALIALSDFYFELLSDADGQSTDSLLRLTVVDESGAAQTGIMHLSAAKPGVESAQ